MNEENELSAGQPVGYFYTCWRGDPLPDLGLLEGYGFSPAEDVALLEHLSDLTCQEVRERMKNGHRPYLAWMNEQPVAYGWSAWKRAEVGELGLSFEMPPGNRYLWDFVTLPGFRGQGIYPRMIQGIIREESGDADRFWIGHDLDNIASARGIEKAGVPVIGEVHIREGKPVFVGREPRERAQAAAKLLGLSLVFSDD